MDRQTTLTHDQLQTLFEIASELVLISDITFDNFAEVIHLLLENVAGVDDDRDKEKIVLALWSMKY